MLPYSTLDDLELLTLMGTGDEHAFTELYSRYAAPLYRYAYSRIHSQEDAEEILQEIFLWLWEKRHSLDHITALKPYLYSAVRYRVADRIAHSTIREKYASDFALFEDGCRNTTEELMNLSDIQTTVERTLAALPENCQKAFRLSRMEHLSISDIAARMNLSTGTVENYISHALKHLRGRLG